MLILSDVDTVRARSEATNEHSDECKTAGWCHGAEMKHDIIGGQERRQVA